MRAVRRQTPVPHQPHQPEHHELDQDQRHDRRIRPPRIREHHHHRRDHRHHHRTRHNLQELLRIRPERHDHRAQIHRQRQHPQQRQRRDVHRQMARHTQQHRRRDERVEHPPRAPAPGDRRPVPRPAAPGIGLRDRPAAREHHRPGAEHHEHPEPREPQITLRPDPQRRLDQHRVRQQTQQIPPVARGVQKYGSCDRPCRARANQPCTSGPRARDHEEREPRDQQQLPDQPRHRELRRRGRRVRLLEHNPRNQREHQQPHMPHQLRHPRHTLDHEVRVQIPQQEHRLEIQHRRRPDRRGPPEIREQRLGDHGLHRKKQHRPQEHRRHEVQDHRVSRSAPVQ